MGQFILTDEQSRVVFSELDEIRIASGAGVGKTSTLEEFTNERPESTFLYLTYTADMKKSSRKKFGSNVEVHSISSLAYKVVGAEFKDKIINNFTIQMILDQFDLNYIEADQVLKILELYFNSNKDVPPQSKSTRINEAVDILFSGMIDPENKDIKTPHEAYTKYFQILSIDLNYDFIIVDEAQDVNKVAKAIIDSQENAKKIFVGDELQGIFSYRGTVSLLDNPTHHLTKSFRFGKNVANLVQTFIRDYYDKSYIVSSSLPDCTFNEERDTFTYISRTNSHLFDKALELSNLGRPFFIHNSKEVFQLLKDGYNLLVNNKEEIKSKYIKSFKNFEHLEGVSKKIDDLELNYLVRVVSKYKENIFKYIKVIERYVVSEEYAEVILITTHKAKGLEWDNIELGNDFFSLYDRFGDLIKPSEIPESELFVLYVAMTRVKSNICLNDDLYKRYKEIL